MKPISANDLTTEECIHLIDGNSFWSMGGIARVGLPVLKVTDASNGIREQYRDEGYSSRMGNIPAVCYPSLCTCGCSFDEALLFDLGKALGEECKSRGIAVLLGPGINLKRNPLCGRNFEYISEDPLLSGKLGAAFIRGVQSTGVAACPKHFAANSQETRRMKSNSVVDPKTLFELYLRSFEIAVKEGQPWVIMGAYNRLNGIYCCENSWLLNDVLRKTWGFDGLVISDWGGVNDIIRSVNAGLDVDMPGAVGDDHDYLRESAENGQLKKSAMRRAAANVIRLAERTEGMRGAEENDREEAHLAAARRAAAESFVLLKNEREVLPLKKEDRILAVGPLAKSPRYQGSGSGKVKMSYAETPWMALKEKYPDCRYVHGYSRDPEKNDVFFSEALQAAEEADRVLVFAGIPEICESEGFDRENMKLPDEEDRLIKALARRNPNVIVILQAGAPVEMPWKEEIAALVMCYLGGSCLGSALAELLDGTVNPSGRLAESFPVRLSDTPSYEIYPANENNAVYREKTDVGYRYYNRKNIPTAFPFGTGLSYTQFAYRKLQARFDGDCIQAECVLRNTGKRDGKEVIQLYFSDKAHPEMRILAGFRKVFLKAEEEKTVSLSMDPRYLSGLDEEQHCMRLKAGEYRLFAGRNSAEMILETELVLKEDLVWPVYAAASPASETGDAGSKRRITTNTSLRDLEKYRVMRPVIKAIRAAGSRMTGGIITSEKMPDVLLDAPFRQIPMGTNGRVKAKTVRKACAFFDKLVNKKKKIRYWRKQ